LDCVAHDVTIGTQTWTGCNLDVTTFRNGDPIPEVTDPSAWIGLTTPAWCYYNNNSANGTTYGKLYNWYAVSDPRGLAPVGYHIPSSTEWSILINYLGGDVVAGGELKETGFCHWESPNTGATDSSGFTALPGGQRNGITGVFNFVTLYGFFVSSTDGDIDNSIGYTIYHNIGNISLVGFDKQGGFSVRLIKD
jgi:uncharacterized protein (TIGR02145 family)